MDKRILLLPLTILLAGTVLFTLITLTAAASQDLPTVSTVSPSSAYNNLDTSLVISGTGFSAVLSGTQPITIPEVYLGDLPLGEVTWVSPEQLTASLPWGAPPGTYTLTVTNPDGGSGSLAGAFTVLAGIGVWTSNGPFGGNIFSLAMSPANTQTLHATVWGVGLFVSQDGGTRWQPSGWEQAGSVSYVGYGGPAQTSLYAVGGMGFYKSPDHGLTWTALYTEGGTTNFAVDPTDSSFLYLTDWGHGVLCSRNGGLTWQACNDGLSNLHTRTIYIDPNDPAKLFVTTDGGFVFRSNNRGEAWSAGMEGLIPSQDWSYQLAADPHHPGTWWAMRGRGNLTAHLARTTNGGDLWTTVSFLDGEAMEVMRFDPMQEDVVYGGGGHQVFRSEDGGLTWSTLNETEIEGMIQVLVLDPESGALLYAGNNETGFWRSADGGIHWENAVDGLAGIQPGPVVSPPGDPSIVYMVSGAGFFYSNNGGTSWAQATRREGFTVATDPFHSQAALLSGWEASSMARTEDGGRHWASISWPERPSYITALAFHPGREGLVYGGGGDDWGDFERSRGWLARSLDGGFGWETLQVGHPISDVTAIVVDPVVNSTLYLGTCAFHPHYGSDKASGILKSVDGAASWAFANQGLTYRCVHDLILHPENHDLLLAAVLDYTPGAPGIFRSEDGASSWEASSRGMDTGQVLELAVDPLDPADVYAATWHGLWRSRNYGLDWARVEGPLGHVPVMSVWASAVLTRTVIYAGTIGGLSVFEPDGAQAAQQAAGLVGSGIYQFTILHGPRMDVYLPVVRKK